MYTNLEYEQVYHCDVDDTLVMWDDKPFEPGPGKTEFSDPYDGTKVFLTPHKRHIKLLKDKFARGFLVVVWSANGNKWAKTVIDTLGLAEHCHFTMTKNTQYCDDLQAEEVLGKRIYIKDYDEE